jgi:hypothetical protein
MDVTCSLHADVTNTIQNCQRKSQSKQATETCQQLSFFQIFEQTKYSSSSFPHMHAACLAFLIHDLITPIICVEHQTLQWSSLCFFIFFYYFLLNPNILLSILHPKTRNIRETWDFQAVKVPTAVFLVVTPFRFCRRLSPPAIFRV